MAFNQNQDTLRTLKLILFLILIEILIIFASTISVLSSGVSEESFLYSPKEVLHIEDFKYHSLGVIWHYNNGLLFPEFTFAYYEDSNGHVFRVDNKKDLQTAIDKYNGQKPQNAFDFLGLLVASISFSAIPYPLSIVPLLLTSIIAFIILYLVAGEVKAWFDTVYPL